MNMPPEPCFRCRLPTTNVLGTGYGFGVCGFCRLDSVRRLLWAMQPKPRRSPIASDLFMLDWVP